MRPSDALNIYRAELRKIILMHRVENPRIFGSVLDGTDTNDSDLDILVDPTAETTLFDMGGIIHESRLLGIVVHVVTARMLPPSCREKVLREAVPL